MGSFSQVQSPAVLRNTLASEEGAANVRAKNPAAGGVVRTLQDKFNETIYADDFNGDIAAAIAALPASGGTVILGAGVYTSPYQNTAPSATPVAMSKKNVRIKGVALPSFNSSNTALEGGSIIQGNFNFGADGFSIDKVGIDVGSDYCAANHAGVEQEGLTSVDPQGFGGAVTDTWHGLDIGDIIVLASGAESAVHAVLIENYGSGKINYIRSRLGGAGQVYKSFGLQINTIDGGGHGKYTALFKSESFSKCGNINVGNIICRSLAVASPDYNTASDYDTNGVWFQGASGDCENINIGNVIAIGCKIPVYIQGLTNDVNNINITSIYCERSFSYPIGTSNVCRRINIGKLISRMSGDGVNVGGSTVNFNLTQCILDTVDGYGFTNFGTETILDTCKVSGATVGNIRNLGGSLTISNSPSLSAPFNSGGTINGMSATSIGFPAVQVPSSDPNTLDDYEEGFFTPTISFGGNSVGVVYSQQVGSYTKIGRVVHFSAWIFLVNKGSSTGNLEVSLPFTSQAVSSRIYAAITVATYGNFAGIDGQIMPLVDSSDAKCLLTMGGASGVTVLTEANILNSGNIAITGTYTVNT